MGRFFDSVAPGWDEVADSAPENLAPLAAAVEAIETPPARILDLGTGTGRAAFWLVARFPAAEVTGVDLSQEMVRIASERVGPDLAGRVSFQAADAAALPFAAGSFDLVTLMNVPVFFDEISRVLAPGGHVAIVSSLGAATPFHTPHPTLRARFKRHGVAEAAAGAVGQSLWFLARKRD